MCDGGSSQPAAPDSSAVAAASLESAKLGKELGDAQLAEARRQYDENVKVAKPVVEKQIGLMDQQKTQGDDYYKYQTDTFRPLEKDMVAKAALESSDARAEEAASMAAADARRGQTQQTNSMVRQGLRYGYSPAKLAAMAGGMAGANASSVAGATTGARNQQRQLGWAKSMDAAGLGRNLAGASIGAYSGATNAGNAAVGNQMAPGNALMNGMNQSNATTMQGQGIKVGGLGAALNAQTSAYNAGMNQDSGMGGLGSLLGGAAAMKTAFSDRRLKSDIVLVGSDPTTNLNVYEFRYKYSNDETRFRGFMADEVEAMYPDAVEYDDIGFASVDYGMLGVPMQELGAN